MTVSENGLVGTHSSDLFDYEGVLISDEPLERTTSGTVSFCLKIVAVEPGTEEGMAVGVTNLSPADILSSSASLPDRADLVERAWVIGVDGAIWDGAVEDWDESNFFPAKLNKDDVVTVTLALTPSRTTEMVILVNDEEQARHTVKVPMASPLFALVDICGNTKAVSIGKDAGAFTTAKPAHSAPKPKAGRGRAKANPNSSRGGDASTSRTSVSSARPFTFDGVYHGSAVKFSMSDTHAMTDCVDDKAIVLTKDPLLPSGSGDCVSFKLEIKSIKDDAATEGLFAVGVTSVAPSAIQDIGNLASGDALNPAWLLGFDGAFWNGDWAEDDFFPEQLAAGDVLTLNVRTVQQTRKIELLVNANLKSSYELPQLEPGCPLYGVVDLSGRITCVSLVQPMQVSAPRRPQSIRARRSVKNNLDAGNLAAKAAKDPKIIRWGDD